MTTTPISPPAGRTAETARLGPLVGGLDDGGGALLVRGGAGIGKSTLLDWAASLARDSGTPGSGS